MNGAAWERAKSLLAEAADLPAGDRARFVVEHCPDPELRREVLDLLASPAPLTEIVLAGALRPGDRLGPYVVDELLGSGGMGEVYRARDTKLGRDVALKVLPDSLTHDSERLERLAREAHLLAALNHPHIAHVYGFEDSTGVPALVMELVEGPTLADRIAHGPIPLDEALPIARQIAEALEAAHDHGIIHRDLKPANIKVRDDGTVKVLDFGLAKAFDPTASSGAGATMSPTLSNHATEAGMILGTAAYMAPEQARGQAVDRRADIWAFGCVLFEMLTGARAFSGSNVSEVLASVLKTEPDWGALPSNTPPNIQRLLHRCLEKDPRRRLQAFGDARLEIEDALAGAAETLPVSSRARERRWREALPWSILAVVAIAALGAAMYLTTRPRPAPSGGVTRLEIRMPPGVRFNDRADLSPDGRRVAFVGAYGAGRQVYVRELDQLDAYPLSSTATNVMTCFFSPEGRAVGFYSGEHVLKRVTLSDDVAVTLARDVTLGDGSWGRDGQITFLRAGELWQVPAVGGTPKPLTRLDPRNGEVGHLFPTAIGAGQVILFEVRNQRGESHIEAVSAATGARRVLEESGAQPRYASSGHLLFRQGTDLFAAPFDADRLMTTAPAVRVLRNVEEVVSVSSTGSLFYSEPWLVRIVWVSRQGLEEPIGEAGRYFYPALSPDGRHVALTILPSGGVPAVMPDGGVWDQDVVRGTLTRLTDGRLPIWTPDGKRVVVETASGMKWVDAGGGEPAQPIAGSSAGDMPDAVTPDGKMLAFSRISPDTQSDMYVRSLDGRAPPRPLLHTPAYEGAAQFSPDGRRIAYVSDESGLSEIYVRPFPEFDRKWQVSTHGGTEPRWSRNGRELFYRSDDRMMSVQLSNNADNPFSQPVLLFERQYLRSRTRPVYDVAPDGRFLMIRDEPGTGRLNLIVNWIEELKARMAAEK